jgi:hypothetical protein
MQQPGRARFLKMPRHPCPVPGCVDRDVDRAVHCPRHAKQQARTGSALHHGLTLDQRRPVVKVIGLLIRRELRAHDLQTEMMVNELRQLLQNLPSGLPRLNELRGRRPLVKAQAVLYHVNRQRWVDRCITRIRTAKTEQTWAIRLLALCMSSELLAPSVCSAPRYVQTQVSQGVYAQLWPKEPKRYVVDDGRGGVTRTVIWNARPSSLQSRWTAQRLYELMSPCYLTWYRAHVDEIKTAIPASEYTKAE